MATNKLYDPKCYELAKHILGAHAPERFVKLLETDIKRAIKEFLRKYEK